MLASIDDNLFITSYKLCFTGKIELQICISVETRVLLQMIYPNIYLYTRRR